MNLYKDKKEAQKCLYPEDSEKIIKIIILENNYDTRT